MQSSSLLFSCKLLSSCKAPRLATFQRISAFRHTFPLSHILYFDRHAFVMSHIPWLVCSKYAIGRGLRNWTKRMPQREFEALLA